jgi:hypothetical protein
MKTYLFLLLLIGHISFGQTSIAGISVDNFLGDSINSSPNTAFNTRIKLCQIDNSPAKVDIRLYRLHSLSNTKTLHRITLDGTSWKAVVYEEFNNPIKIIKRKLTAKPSFDSLFLRLLSHNILTLPNQTDLEKKMTKDVQVDKQGNVSERKMIVVDGEGYTIEIKFHDKFRVYQFDNPEIYSKFYDQVSELKDYLDIVQVFNKYLE